MLKKNIEDICNRQVEREGYSSSLYLAMASWAETNGFNGVAGWLYVQAEEERMHMLKFIKYINERDGKAIISGIKQPPVEFKGVEEMFHAVLEHEEFITDSINEIVSLTHHQKDNNTQNIHQTYVTEHIEEEASARTILDKLRLVGKNNLYQFDRDIMDLRTSTAAAQENA